MIFTVILCILSLLRGTYNKFPEFFVWALLLIVHTWNTSPLQSNLLRLQCTCCTIPTTSGRPHGSPLVWACRWSLSQPLSSLGRGQHSSNRVSGISTRTMHQSTTPSLSQTIWPRWASRQFFSLPTVLTLLPVTFGYSLSSEAVVMRQLRRWKRLWRRSPTCSHKRTSMGPSRSCWNGTSALQPEEITLKRNKEVLSIKVSTRKKSGNLFNDPHIYYFQRYNLLKDI